MNGSVKVIYKDKDFMTKTTRQQDTSELEDLFSTKLEICLIEKVMFIIS